MWPQVLHGHTLHSSHLLFLGDLIGQSLGGVEDLYGCLVLQDVSLRGGEGLQDLVLDLLQLLFVGRGLHDEGIPLLLQLWPGGGREGGGEEEEEEEGEEEEEEEGKEEEEEGEGEEGEGEERREERVYRRRRLKLTCQLLCLFFSASPLSLPPSLFPTSPWPPQCPAAGPPDPRG